MCFLHIVLNVSDSIAILLGYGQWFANFPMYASGTFGDVCMQMGVVRKQKYISCGQLPFFI